MHCSFLNSFIFLAFPFSIHKYVFILLYRVHLYYPSIVPFKGLLHRRSLSTPPCRDTNKWYNQSTCNFPLLCPCMGAGCCGSGGGRGRGRSGILTKPLGARFKRCGCSRMCTFYVESLRCRGAEVESSATTGARNK